MIQNLKSPSQRLVRLWRKISNLKSQNGFALVTVLFVMIVLVAVGTLFISMVVFEMKIANNQKNSTKAFYLAESGVEIAIWKMNLPGSTYTGEQNTLLEGGKFSTEVVVHPSDLNKRIITSTGFYPANASFPAKRKIKLTLSANPTQVGGAFHYALHVGLGGVLMSNGSQIQGDVYSNGEITSLTGSQSGTITGSVWVASGNKIQNINIGLDAHANIIDCLLGSPCLIGQDAYYRTTLNNYQVSRNTYPGEPDPAPIDLPIKAGDPIITKWENDAAAGGTQGNTTIPKNTTVNLGPKKIEGDLLVENGATLNVTGVIWVTGNMDFSQGSITKLDATIYQDYSGVILTDNSPNPGGQILIENNAFITGSGDPKSALMLLTTNQGNDTSNYAIDGGNNTGTVVLYATDGIVWIENNATLNEITAKRIWLKQNAIVVYDRGLADPKFISGPGGLWVEDKRTWSEEY